MKLWLDTSKTYAIALEGGGAKGAYEVGVWRALDEADVRFDAVAGTSVGALNGAMMVMGELEQALRLWENIRFSQVFDADDEQLKKLYDHKLSEVDFRTLFKDAMEAIRMGKADYAVLPIENSSAGIVSENYDLLVEYDNYIVGEQIVKINHALLGLEDADESEITSVFSHKQSLMQCSDFLEEHKQWEKFSVSNNAVAARKVKEDNDKHQAAIASAKNAQIYGLKVLRNSIQDNKNNSTRFIVVTGKKIYTKVASSASFQVST